jgi:predicted KAP-like P-loop ATPase
MSSYVADAPISDPKLDRFDRWPFAKRIADTIAMHTDRSSLVIALYGIWGDGKTTVLNFVDNELRSKPNVVVVRFNPWRFPDEQSLLRSFFATLAKALEVSLTNGKEEIGKSLAKYGGLLNVVWSGAGSAAKEAGELLSNINLDDEKRRIEAILSENGKKVVVLMDDIDRLKKRKFRVSSSWSS